VNLACDPTFEWKLPVPMSAPDETDLPSDEDSDEEEEFEIEVPNLFDLMNEFEKDDEIIHKMNANLEEKKKQAKLKGQKLGPLDEIHDTKEEHFNDLNDKISKTREEWMGNLNGYL